MKFYGNRMDEYEYSQEVKEMASKVIDALGTSLIDGQKQLAEIALKLIDRIATGNIQTKNADGFFTLINVIVGDLYPDMKLDKHIDDLILEGMTLHDYGTSFGASLDLMKEKATSYLANNGSRPFPD